MVAAELPSATELDLAFVASGGISGGTLKSAWEGMALGGGRARIGGELRTVPVGWRTREVAFPSAPRKVTSLPWGDVSTAYRSTGIGDITTFTRLPGFDRLGSRGAERGRAVASHPIAQRLGKALIGAAVRGPGPHRRSTSWTEVYAEARDARGQTVAAALIGPNTYDLTADAVLRTVSALQSGESTAGAHTPSTAFGADFVRRLHGIRVVEPSRR
jgi:saccharopine dehydrogenase (NAD+, L-lysine-forming)